MSCPTEKPLARAAAHLAQRQYSEAAGAYRAVLSIDPQEYRAYFGLADCAVGRGQLDEAVEELVGAAQDFAEREKLQPAFALMTKAMMVDPARLELHIDVAELEAAAGRTDLAIARLTNLAHAYEGAGQLDEAEAVVEAALVFESMGEADPEEPAPQDEVEAVVPEEVAESMTEIVSVHVPAAAPEPPAYEEKMQAHPVPSDFADPDIRIDAVTEAASAEVAVPIPVQTGDTFVGAAPRVEQSLAREAARRDRRGSPRWRPSTIQMQALTHQIPKPDGAPNEVTPGRTMALIHRPPKTRASLKLSALPAPKKKAVTMKHRVVAPAPLKKPAPLPRKTIQAAPRPPKPPKPSDVVTQPPVARVALQRKVVKRKAEPRAGRPAVLRNAKPASGRPVAGKRPEPAPRKETESLADRLRRHSRRSTARPQLAAKVKNIAANEKSRAKGELFEDQATRLWCPEDLLDEPTVAQ